VSCDRTDQIRSGSTGKRAAVLLMDWAVRSLRPGRRLTVLFQLITCGLALDPHVMRVTRRCGDGHGIEMRKRRSTRDEILVTGKRPVIAVSVCVFVVKKSGNVRLMIGGSSSFFRSNETSALLFRSDESLLSSSRCPHPPGHWTDTRPPCPRLWPVILLNTSPQLLASATSLRHQRSAVTTAVYRHLPIRSVCQPGIRLLIAQFDTSHSLLPHLSVSTPIRLPDQNMCLFHRNLRSVC
jgi:hypothetical protein